MSFLENETTERNKTGPVAGPARTIKVLATEKTGGRAVTWMASTYRCPSHLRAASHRRLRTPAPRQAAPPTSTSCAPLSSRYGAVESWSLASLPAVLSTHRSTVAGASHRRHVPRPHTPRFSSKLALLPTRMLMMTRHQRSLAAARPVPTTASRSALPRDVTGLVFFLGYNGLSRGALLKSSEITHLLVCVCVYVCVFVCVCVCVCVCE
jgi:hypothetical protein